MSDKTLKFIFNKCNEGYSYTFPASRADIDEDLVAKVPGLRDAIEEFARALTAQLNEQYAPRDAVAGVRIHGFSFSMILARTKSNR